MASRNETMQRIWHQYDSKHGHRPTSAKQAVTWAVRDRLLNVPEIDPLDILADQMSQALREEYRVDEEGRR